MAGRHKKIAPLMDVDALQNDVVRFKIFEQSDASFLSGSSAVEEMWKWMPAVDKGSGPARYMQHILKQSDAGKAAAYTIFRKSDDAFAGVAGFIDIDPFHRQLRIGFAWHPENMLGTMVYPSVQLLMIERAYSWYAKRVSWHVSPENTETLNAMAFLGVTREGLLRNYIRTAGGKWSDMIVFSLLRDEMREAIVHLKETIAAAQLPPQAHPA